MRSSGSPIRLAEVPAASHRRSMGHPPPRCSTRTCCRAVDGFVGEAATTLDGGGGVNGAPTLDGKVNGRSIARTLGLEINWRYGP